MLCALLMLPIVLCFAELAGYFRNTGGPARDMPLGLLLALGVVTLLYALIQMVSMAAVPDIAASTSPLLDAASILISPVGAIILIWNRHIPGSR